MNVPSLFHAWPRLALGFDTFKFFNLLGLALTKEEKADLVAFMRAL